MMGFFGLDPELAWLDGCLNREKLPSEVLTMHLKVVPVMMTLREDNGIASCMIDIDITRAFYKSPSLLQSPSYLTIDFRI